MSIKARIHPFERQRCSSRNKRRSICGNTPKVCGLNIQLTKGAGQFHCLIEGSGHQLTQQYARKGIARVIVSGISSEKRNIL